MEQLVAYLLTHHISISSMESLTGGLFASQLTAYSGISAVFKGTLVTYTDKVKERLGHVERSVIQKHGAISAECARAMAINAQQLFQSDVSVSFTGNAGPSAAEGKPVGAVYSCIRYHDDTYDYYDVIEKERNELRLYLVNLTAERIVTILNNAAPITR